MLNNLNISLTLSQVLTDWTVEQLFTYIIAPILAGIAAIWAVIKVIIPRFTDALLQSRKDAREHQQKMDELQQSYWKAESESTHQMMGNLLERSQDKEERANKFIREEIKEGIDRTKADTSLIPGLIEEQRTIKYEIRNLTTQQKILIGLLTEMIEKSRRTDDD